MKYSSLFTALWACATEKEALAVLANVPHATRPIGERRNNKAPVRANRDPIAAVMEGVTNGHDAVVRLWAEQGRFGAKLPVSVTEAHQRIADSDPRPNPQVYVMLQLRKDSKFAKDHALTIADLGIGMTAQAMLNGVLTYGSEDKVLDMTQFGSFGQGSASLFGHCKFSLIASRRAGSDTVAFTGVWLHRAPGQIHSYVYFTKPDGSLFEFPADSIDAAVPGHRLFETLHQNKPVVPPHGTVRRHLQMEGIPEYYTQRGNSLYYGLQDRLFGCPAYVQMAGDDDPGHLNNRRGREHELRTVAVGNKLVRSDWRLAGYLDATNLMVHYKGTQVGMVQVKVWVIESYRTKPSAKKSNGELKTPARHMLEGSDRGAARSIFVTLNGQTLHRLHSLGVFTEAGLREIAENIIVKVELDLLPPERLQDAEVYLSTRDGLMEWFERALVGELQRYLAGQPALARLAKELIPPDDAATLMETNFSADINKVLADPLFGEVMGIRKVVRPELIRVDDDGQRKSQPKKDKEPITLSDPPTFLELRKDTVIRSATNWFQIVSDAPDCYAQRLVLDLPPFLKQLGPARIDRGRMSVGVECDNVPIGTIGKVAIGLRDTALRDEREVEVVPRKEVPKLLIVLKPGEEKTIVKAPPTIKLVEVSGDDHARWQMFFAAVQEPKDASFNYYLDKNENVIQVGLHVGFPALVGTRRILEKQYGPLIARDFYQRVAKRVQIDAMVLLKNELLKSFSDDPMGVAMLADILRANVVSNGILYRDVRVRNQIITSATFEEAA